MGLEYQTGRFDNNSYGVEARMHWINQMAGQGWRIASETVEPGHVRGGQACCLATLCLPLGFAAGRTEGMIAVTLCKESGGLPGHCSGCGHKVLLASKYCNRCGQRLGV